MQSKILCSILLLVGLNFSSKAAIYHVEDTIRAEVFLKMIPMQNSSLDQLGLSTMESQMFRENDYITYQKKGSQTRQKGKIIRFKDGEMWVHNFQNDKIDRVKIEDINSLRKQYNFWSFLSLIVSGIGIYFLLIAAILFLLLIIFAAVNNSGTTTGSSSLFASGAIIGIYAFFIGAIGVAISYSGIKSLLPFRKYRIGKKYKVKLYEIKPVE